LFLCVIVQVAKKPGVKFFFRAYQQLSIPNQRYETDGPLFLEAERPKTCGDTYPVFRVHVISGKSWHSEAVFFEASPLCPITVLNIYHLLRYPIIWIQSFLVDFGISFSDGNSVMPVVKECPLKILRCRNAPGKAEFAICTPDDTGAERSASGRLNGARDGNVSRALSRARGKSVSSPRGSGGSRFGAAGGSRQGCSRRVEAGRLTREDRRRRPRNGATPERSSR